MLFNQILAPEKSESITKITSSSEIMKSVNKEIVTYSEDYHLAKCDNRIKDIYRELKDSILSISPTITVVPKKITLHSLIKRISYICAQDDPNSV